MSKALGLFRSNDPGDRAKAAELARAAWSALPWRSRLLLTLHREWRGLGDWPLIGRRIASAHLALFDRVLDEEKARRGGEGASVGPPDAVFLGARGDRIISSIILVVGVTGILVRHLGRLLLALGALALLTPFLLWPPCWPELRIAYDAAQRDAEDDQDDER
jgi:hypothetical protein